MYCLRYEWTCQRCRAVELVEHSILDDNPRYPRGWEVVRIGQERKLLCGCCVEELLAVLNTQQERAPAVGAGCEG